MTIRILSLSVALFALASVLASADANRLRHHERLFFDLTHPYDEQMPVRENGSPLEINSVQQDDGNGARLEKFTSF